MKIELGKKGRDKITGFEGIVTAHCIHLYGCDTYALTPAIDKDGKTRDTNWYDEGRIEIIGDGVKPEEVRAEKAGAGGNPVSTAQHP